MLGPFASFGSSVTWAVGSSIYSTLSKTYSPLAVNLSRAIAALTIFLLILTFSGGWSDFQLMTVQEVAWLSVGIVASYATGDAFFLLSSQSLGVPGALAIASSYPIWSALAGFLFLHQPLGVEKILALLMVVAGVVLVLLSDSRRKLGDPADQKSRAFGIVAAFLTSGLWALNSYSNAQVNPAISSAAANTVRMSVGIAVCALLILLTSGRRKKVFWVSAKDWRKYGWLFGFEGAGGAFLFVYGFMHSPLAVASALSSLAPALAVPIALFVRREKLSRQKVVGVLIAVAGVVWLVSR